MSTWRNKAMDILPEYKKDIEEPGTSIYAVFGYMLTALQEAHRANDTSRLKNIYGFAEWCAAQKAKDLWNAAGVAFYEHLGDHRETFEAIPVWLKPPMYEQVNPLLELRLTKEDMQQLDRWYKLKQ